MAIHFLEEGHFVLFFHHSEGNLSKRQTLFCGTGDVDVDSRPPEFVG